MQSSLLPAPRQHVIEREPSRCDACDSWTLKSCPTLENMLLTLTLQQASERSSSLAEDNKGFLLAQQI